MGGTQWHIVIALFATLLAYGGGWIGIELAMFALAFIIAATLLEIHHEVSNA